MALVNSRCLSPAVRRPSSIAMNIHTPSPATKESVQTSPPLGISEDGVATSQEHEQCTKDLGQSESGPNLRAVVHLGLSGVDSAWTCGVFGNTMFVWRPESLRARESFSVQLHGSRIQKLIIRNPFFLFPIAVEQLPRLNVRLSNTSAHIEILQLSLELDGGMCRLMSQENITGHGVDEESAPSRSLSGNGENSEANKPLRRENEEASSASRIVSRNHKKATQLSRQMKRDDEQTASQSRQSRWATEEASKLESAVGNKNEVAAGSIMPKRGDDEDANRLSSSTRVEEEEATITSFTVRAEEEGAMGSTRTSKEEEQAANRPSRPPRIEAEETTRSSRDPRGEVVDRDTAVDDSPAAEDESALDHFLLAYEERRRASQRSPTRRNAAAPVIVERAIGDSMASTFPFGLRLVDFAHTRALGMLDTEWPRSPVQHVRRLERSRFTPYRSLHRRREMWSSPRQFRATTAQDREEAEMRSLRVTTFMQAVENLRGHHPESLATFSRDGGEGLPGPDTTRHVGFLLADEDRPPSLLRARDSLEVMQARYRGVAKRTNQSEEDQVPPSRRRRRSDERQDHCAGLDVELSESEHSEPCDDPLEGAHLAAEVGTSGRTSTCSTDREDDSDEDPPNKIESPVFIPIRATGCSENADAPEHNTSKKEKRKFSMAGNTRSRKRRLGVSCALSRCRLFSRRRTTKTCTQEFTEDQHDREVSDTLENIIYDNNNNEAPTSLRYIGRNESAESTIVNWPSDEEYEQKADARISELLSDHEMVRTLYEDIPEEVSDRSVTTDSESCLSRSSLDTQDCVLSSDAIECHRVSGKLDIDNAETQKTCESLCSTVPSSSTDKEALQLQKRGGSEQKLAQCTMPCKVVQSFRYLDEGTIMIMRPSYVIIRTSPNNMHLRTRKDSSGGIEHVIVRNPEIVLVETRKNTRSANRESTEAIYVNSRTNTLPGAADTDDDDTTHGT